MRNPVIYDRYTYRLETVAISNCVKECSQLTKFSPSPRFRLIFLPPANEVCEGYVFTPVSQSFCSRRGGVYPLGRHTHRPPDRHPLGRSPSLGTHSPYPLGRHPPGRQPLPRQTPPRQIFCVNGSAPYSA